MYFCFYQSPQNLINYEVTRTVFNLTKTLNVPMMHVTIKT